MRGRINKASCVSSTADSRNNKGNKDNINIEIGSDDIFNNNNIVTDNAISNINKMSSAAQQVTVRAERAARCAIRAAVTTKSLIDNTKKSMRGMRKTTITMTDIADSLELLVGHINELCSTIIPINGIACQVKSVAEKNFNKGTCDQNYIEYSDAFKEIIQIIVELDNKTNRISGIVESVLSDVEKCTKAIRNGSKLVEEGYQIANDTSMLMEKVMDTIEDTSGQIDMVLTSAEDVALFSDDTVKLVKDSMPRMVEQI